MTRQVEPLVTVIIPSFNMAEHLPHAVRSVLRQHYHHFEILVVDDGSTDNTEEVAGAFRDRRVHYIRRENGGLSAARNTGLREARGKYICFLDADDSFLPGKTAAQVRFLEDHPYAAMVTGNTLRTDAEWRTLYRMSLPAGLVRPPSLLVSNLFPVNAVLLRASWARKVGAFDETLKGAEDWDYFVRLVFEGGRILHQPQYVCQYRVFPNSMSANPERQTEAIMTVANRIFAHPDLPIALAPLRSRALAEAYLSGAVKAYFSGNIGLGRKYLLLADEHNPELAERDYWPVVNRFVYLSRMIPVAERRALLRRLMTQLPKRMLAMRSHESTLDFLLRKERVFEAWDRRDPREVAATLARLAIRHPFELPRYLLSRCNP